MSDETIEPAPEGPQRTAGGNPVPDPLMARVRVATFLREHDGEPWCSECVAERLNIPKATVAITYLPLEGYAFFRRLDEVCASCGRRRVVLRYDNPFPGEHVGGVLCDVCGDGIFDVGDLVLTDGAARHRTCPLPAAAEDG